jgi:hypothetical protein
MDEYTFPGDKPDLDSVHNRSVFPRLMKNENKHDNQEGPKEAVHERETDQAVKACYMPLLP